MLGQTIYLAEAPSVAPAPDGLVHVAAGDGLPARAMTRSVALRLARALFAAVAALEDCERGDTVVPLGRQG